MDIVLTKGNLKQKGQIVDNKLDIRFEDFEEKSGEKLTNLKSDIFERIDPILKGTCRKIL
jgi:hypothetical protein